MKRLTVSEVHARKVRELNLDEEALDLSSIEAIAGSLRRAATFLCPCSTSSLVRTVVNPLRGLVNDMAAIKTLVEDTLEAIIAHGDILEQRVVSDDGSDSPLLYAAPPSFVMRSSGSTILIGAALPEELDEQIEYVNYVRRLKGKANENLRETLLQLGLIELSYNEWLKPPNLAETPGELIARMDSLLDSVPPSRDVPGLSLIDPTSSIRYYRARWTEAQSQNGRFVGRRSQAYGSDLWCYVEMREGQPERLINLPLVGGRWRGCDEAWRLQMAIDSLRGEPQRFRIHAGPATTTVFEFFSPVPLWARRRWNAVGEPSASSGSLLSYCFSSAEAEEEARFAREALWLKEV